MGHQWIIDVLSDLKSFADRNQLPHLASEIEQVIATGKAEILDNDGGAPEFRARMDDKDTRQILTKA